MPAEPNGASVGAVVDLGSTSVHLLVGRVVDHRIEPLADESAFLGLGEAARERGFLGSEGRALLLDALTGYAWTARETGSSKTTFIGTEPLRRLADAARIVAAVDGATGVPLHVVSHEEEAYLTLVGVMAGRRVEHEVLVVDIGGGSSEFVSIGPGRRAVAAGVRVGAAALTARYVAHDPPTADELAGLRAAAREAVVTTLAATPDEVVLVGGTASNLLKVVPDGLVERRLSRASLETAFRLVATDPAESVAVTHLVRPARARILGAGAAIAEAIIERFGVTQVRVSEAGIREGTVLAVDHAGVNWRDGLEELAHGWLR